MHTIFLFLAASAALLAVGMGAFGAHGLRSHLDESALAIFRTGVEYQMWHALGLGLIGVVLERHPGSRRLQWAGWLMFVGIVLFSGSLYLLTLTNLPWLGIITPFGGMAFIASWLLLAIAARGLVGHSEAP